MHGHICKFEDWVQNDTHTHIYKLQWKYIQECTQTINIHENIWNRSLYIPMNSFLAKGTIPNPERHK